MVGVFSFLLLASMLAFAVAAVLLVLRAVKKKPKKPAVIAIAASVLVFAVSSAGINATYHPSPEQIAERDRQKTEEAARREAEETVQQEPQESDVQSVPAAPSDMEPEPPSESEGSEQPSAPDEAAPVEDPILGSYDSLTEKILYTAEIVECPVMNGTKTERIGSYARIIMAKDDMKSLTSEQMFSFTQNVICSLQGEYNWFTIKMNDGTGMVFPGCILSFDYGVLAEDGTLEQHLGSGFANSDANAFDYYTVEEIEDMD